MVRKLETTLAGWFKQVPFHLPAGGRTWLTNNAWWIVLVGAILSALAALASVQAYLWAEGVTRQYRDAVAYYGITPAAGSSLDMTAVWVSLAFYVAVILLEVMAISPLKRRQKKGWDLMFMAMLVSALSGVVAAVLTVSVSGLLGTTVGLAIGGYFLFEVHSNFSKAHSAKEAK